MCIVLTALTCKKEPPVVPPPSGPDTTSHNFAWTQYKFGGTGGSSYFKDVAIINDSDIWAVGTIYTAGDTMFNAAHWDGNNWELKRISLTLYNSDCTVAGSYFGSMVSVFAFNDGNVIMTDGGDVVQSNASSYSHLPCSNSVRTGAITKFWGISVNEFYAVGATGTAMYFSNGAWTKLPSGTNLNIQDIWGGVNPTTGQEEILAVASNVLAIPQAKALLQISGNAVTAVNDNGLPLTLSSVWFIPGWKYFVGGDGLYATSSIGNSWEADTLMNPSQYTFSIRGTAKNDIFMVGGYGLVSHWNGETLRQYTELGSFYGNYYSVSFKGNTVAAAGSMPSSTVDSYAVILVGTRK